MIKQFKRRYLDLLGSIYVYNEHRGYTAIDRVIEAVHLRWPDDRALIALIEKHRVDERKHYLMFKHWFERRGVMPLAVDRTCGQSTASSESCSAPRSTRSIPPGSFATTDCSNGSAG